MTNSCSALTFSDLENVNCRQATETCWQFSLSEIPEAPITSSPETAVLEISTDFNGWVWTQLPANIACWFVHPLEAGTVTIPESILSNKQDDQSGEEFIAQLAVAGKLTVSGASEAPADGWAKSISLPLPALGPEKRATGKWRKAIKNQLMNAFSSLGSTEQTAAKAGLMLWIDELDLSHQQSQSIEGYGAEHLGDNWHAIMHRREPDEWNSKYWWRRVGSQPVHQQLAAVLSARESCAVEAGIPLSAVLETLNSGDWNSNRFVELCEQFRDSDSEAEDELKLWQACEKVLLMKRCLEI